MNHLDPGVVLALRDGEDEFVHPDALAHLQTCVACRRALNDAREVAQEIAGAFESLDAPSQMEVRKEHVRRRVGEKPRAPRSGRGWRISTPARAAGLLLVFGSAASAAVPGWPLHRWLTGDSAAPVASGPAVASPPTATASVATTSDGEGGVRVSATGAPVVVEVTGMSGGGSVVVRWVDGADVSVLAPGESAFRSSRGSVSVAAPFGPVLVEIPRSARNVSVLFEDRLLFRWRDGASEVALTPDEIDAGEKVFITPDP
ncbi:MAG: hypothetical protein OEZ65_10060 [Gemmatimonadota bacterium]|nr:hypothetical protein [Gemmatimonadota bacterium]MDH5759922.1 hypothetical protein [Gemmatimonadota bacterium]